MLVRGMFRDRAATAGGLFGEKVRMRAEQYLNPDRRSDSRVLHALESCLSHPAVALSIVGADAVWVVFSMAVGFPSRLRNDLPDARRRGYLGDGARHPAHAVSPAGSDSTQAR